MKRLLQFGQSVANQFSRMIDDDGRHDKVFYYQEHKLKEAIIKLKDATDEVVRASNRLQMSLMERTPPDQQLH